MKTSTKAVFFALATTLFIGEVTNANASPGSTEIVATVNNATAVPATGTQQLSFTAPRFGRYALQVKSDQGTALQLIDRENGPGEWHGTVGKHNGRFDTFLEAGDYRLRVQSSKRGSGVANVELQAFKELHPEALQLVELKPVNTTLADFEQRSWWLELDEPRRIVIEAGGRNLQSLELWRDGLWRVPLTVETETITPQLGKPLRRLSFSVQLEAGQYRLSAYGGAGETWAETSDAAPMHLRWGVPALPAANRQQFQASPLGIDRYRVPDTADYFRLELPESLSGSLTATLAAADWFLDDPLTEGPRSSITKESRLPVATLKLSSKTPVDDELDAGSRLITVHAPAGQPYTLQQFPRSSNYRIRKSGDWWIDSIHAGTPEDAIDATALLVAVHPSRNLSRIKATTAVEIDQKQGWNRRFNLLQPAELFLQILEDGDYEFTQLGRKTDPEVGDYKRPVGFANLTLEPVYLNRPKNSPSPVNLEENATQTLSAGLYQLRLEPRRKGIVEVAIFHSGTTIPAENAVQGSNRFGAVELEKGWQHIVIPADQGGIDSGLILRPLPLDMNQPLSVTLAANESLSLPLQIPAKGELTAVDEYGNQPKLRSSWRRKGVGKLSQPAGKRKLTLSNTAERPAVISLNWHDPKKQPGSPLPKAAAIEPTALPRLISGKPQFISLASNSAQTFELQVDKPALYRIESTGLLATSGQLRTRVTPNLATAESNGVGRNFLIQRYLRPGDYRLTVGSQGASAGRLGVTLSAAPLIDAGQLHSDITSRQLLPAGQGLDQRFNITEAGQYELQVLSQLPQLRFRLEDGEGWPVLPPGNDSLLNLQLAAGSFRLIIEPGAVDGRVVTRLAAKPKAPEFTGHGPHTVRLNQSVKKRWMEPAEGEPRQPDQWHFSLTAAATINISASNEMRGVLYQIGTKADASSENKQITEVLSPSGWQGELPAGDYRLELKHGRRSNRVDYQLQISSTQLLPGQSRTVTAPISLPLSLPSGLSRIASFGPADVRARLYDNDGNAVASNDDATGDWNFLIGTSLPAGKYRLEVEPVSARRARTEISVSAPTANLLPTQRLELDQLHEQTLDLQAQYTLPLGVAGRDGQLLLVRADAADDDTAIGDIGIALEQCNLSKARNNANALPSNTEAPSGKTEIQCQRLANHSGQPAWLAIALGSATKPATEKVSYRLRLWSQNDQATANLVRVRLLHTEPESISEQELADGLALPAARLIPGPLTSDDQEGWAAAALKLPEAGVFIGSTTNLRFAAGPDSNGRALQSTALPKQFLASKQTLIAGLSGGRLQAQRRSLSSGEELSLPLRSGDIATLNAATADSPTLVIAKAHNGQPGIATVGSTTAADTGFSEREAITIIDPNAKEQTTLRAWKADGHGLLALRLQRIALAPMQTLAPDDQGRIVLPPSSAVTIALPAGRKNLQLALPSETAVVLKNEITLWSGANSSSDTLQSDANELRIYHSGTQPALFSLQQSILTSDSKATKELSKSSPLWQTSLTSSSRQHVRVNSPAGKPLGLELGGNIQSATWAGDNGRHVSTDTKPASKLEITGGGILSISANPGLLAAWLNGAEGGAETDAQISIFANGDSQPLSIPGMATVIGKQAFSFSTTKPQLLSVRGHAPALLQLQSNNEKPNRTLQANGTRLDQYLPAGNHELSLQLLGQKTIDSLKLTTRSVIEISAEPATTGQNKNVVAQAPAMRLAAGDSVLFSFNIDSERNVGIGIQASPDQATAMLMGPSGMVIGTGSTQLQSLKAGRYLLKVSAPANGESLEVSPRIIGLQKQDDGPPADIRNNYIQQARATAEGSR